ALRHHRAGDDQSGGADDHDRQYHVPDLEVDLNRPALGLLLAGQEIDADHRLSPWRRNASPMPTVSSGATFITSWPAKRPGSYWMRASGFTMSAGTWKRRLRKSVMPGVSALPPHTRMRLIAPASPAVRR